MTFLCNPGWYVHKPYVQNKWDDNTHNSIKTTEDFSSLKIKIKMPNKWRTIESLHTKFDFTVDEGKEWLNPSREKK